MHPGGAKTRVPSNPKLVRALPSGDAQGLGAGILPSRFPLVEEARGENVRFALSLDLGGRGRSDDGHLYGPQTFLAGRGSTVTNFDQPY